MVQRYSFNTKKQNYSINQKAINRWSFFDKKSSNKRLFIERNTFNIFMKIKEFFS